MKLAGRTGALPLFFEVFSFFFDKEYVIENREKE